MTDLTPREIVSELDRFIIGQKDAKRAVAVALRNRWRRKKLGDDLRDEVYPKNILMIGPTGVGKTTTIAKLAATLKLKHGRRVGLITADSYRIAAVEQLRTYAGIIGVPVKVALSPSETAQARAALADCDITLIDTAGRSPGDEARLGELAAFLDAAEPAETHLVLSASMAERSLARAADRFGRLGPGRLILSKLDEADGLGVIVSAAIRAGLPISYVSTGQEVPDDFEPANADRLARLALEGEGHS